LHIPAIAFDRFVAILYPLHYEDRMTPLTICCIVTIIWFVAAAVSLPSYVGFATSLVPPQSCIVTLLPVVETVVELSFFFINASVVAFVYLKIWSIAMHHETQQQQQPQPHVSTVSRSVQFSTSSGLSDDRHIPVLGGNGVELPPVAETKVVVTGNSSSAQNRCWPRRRFVKTHRATRTIMTILGVFIIMWFPYIFGRLLEFVLSESKVQTLRVFGSILGSTSFSLNVFIYSLTNSDFSRAFKRILHIGTNEVHSLSGST
jgi:hypothetical protein